MKISTAVAEQLAKVSALLPQQGKVTAVVGVTVTVDLYDGTAPVVLPRFKSYTAPAVNDIVMVGTSVSGTKFVMGAIA